MQHPLISVDSRWSRCGLQIFCQAENRAGQQSQDAHTQKADCFGFYGCKKKKIIHTNFILVFPAYCRGELHFLLQNTHTHTHTNQERQDFTSHLACVSSVTLWQGQKPISENSPTQQPSFIFYLKPFFTPKMTLPLVSKLNRRSFALPVFFFSEIFFLKKMMNEQTRLKSAPPNRALLFIQHWIHPCSHHSLVCCHCHLFCCTLSPGPWGRPEKLLLPPLLWNWRPCSPFEPVRHNTKHFTSHQRLNY